jgi:acyl-CoA reductase-like NAD-dependent aldehyde dehydrogenase
MANTKEELEALVAKVKEAQRRYSTYTQEQVDHIFMNAAIRANEQRIELAKLAVEETGMGVVEDKVIKNHFSAELLHKVPRRPERNAEMHYGHRKVGPEDRHDIPVSAYHLRRAAVDGSKRNAGRG